MQLKINIKKGDVLFFLMVMPYLKPYNVTLIPMLDNFFKIWKIVSTVFILVKFIKKRSKLHMVSVYLLAFCAIWACSLIINKGPVSDFINNILSIVGVILLFESNSHNERFKMQLPTFLYKIGAIYMILNCMTAVQGYPFFAADMRLGDNANFLGGDNYSAFILIVLSGLMFFYDVKFFYRIRLRTWFFTVIGFISLAIPFSLTGIISYLFLLAMVLFYRYPFIRKILTWKTMLLVNILFVLSIGYLRLDILLSNMLGSIDKVGFNGRNMIWPMTIAAILKKPLLGYGGLTGQQAGTWIIAGANHTHNLILEIPFSTGLLGAFFFTLFITKVLKGTEEVSTCAMDILLITLSAYFLCATFDFYLGLVWFYILFYMIWTEKNEIKLLHTGINSTMSINN